jgi:hypothetical protein
MIRSKLPTTVAAIFGALLLVVGYLHYSVQKAALLAADEEVSGSRSDRAWVFADEFVPASALIVNHGTARLTVKFNLVNLGRRTANNVRMAASLHAYAGELPLGSLALPACGAVETSQSDSGLTLVPSDQVAKSRVVTLDPESRIPEESFSLIVAGCMSYDTENGAKPHRTRFGYAVLHTGGPRTLAFEPGDFDIPETSLRLVLLPPLESAD